MVTTIPRAARTGQPLRIRSGLGPPARRFSIPAAIPLGDRYVIRGSRRLHGASILRCGRGERAAWGPGDIPRSQRDSAARDRRRSGRPLGIGSRPPAGGLPVWGAPPIFRAAAWTQRLILAAWPGGAPAPLLHSYGPEAIRRCRGGPGRRHRARRRTTMSRSPATRVAASVEDRPLAGGVLSRTATWPALAGSARMDLTRSLDGCLGDAYFGSYYKFRSRFSRRARYAEKLRPLRPDHSVAPGRPLTPSWDATWGELF
mgnify:CR=1 FL=1